jgi:hypothetical protein
MTWECVDVGLNQFRVVGYYQMLPDYSDQLIYQLMQHLVLGEIISNYAEVK